MGCFKIKILRFLMSQDSVHGKWRNRWTFILAASGSAIGLGNIWKFPYIAGENGGGAFVLVYLLCISLIALPVLIAEVSIGKATHLSPINSIKLLSERAKASKYWVLCGWGAVIAGFLILSFYMVVAGWSLHYVLLSVQGAFNGLDGASSGALFGDFLASPSLVLGYSTVFLAATMLCLGKGIEKGIAATINVAMPSLVGLLILLVIYGAAEGDFNSAFEFLFRPDFSKLTFNSLLVALGHSFFTLGLGAGAMMIYGAYMPDDVSITKAGVQIALTDTLIALTAGMAIFPIVFANGLEPGQGPDLIFIALPVAFGGMPFGSVFACLFFLMLSCAAFTSAISMVESTMAYIVERKGFTRMKAARIVGVLVWLVGLGSALSFNVMSDVTLFEKNYFDLIDYVTTNILLPLVSLGTIWFASWVMADKDVLSIFPDGRTPLLVVVGRWVAPLGIVVIFASIFGFL
jgi:NSS family neurotransmitter:Na+ symporter